MEPLAVFSFFKQHYYNPNSDVSHNPPLETAGDPYWTQGSCVTCRHFGGC